MKTMKFLLAFMLVVTCVFAFSACNDASPDYDVVDDSSDYYVDDTDTDSDSEEDADTEDSTEENSLMANPLTETAAREIYQIISPVYEKYSVVETEQWKAYTSEEKTAAYTAFTEMDKGLGISSDDTEAEWIEDVDWYMENSGTVWHSALGSFSNTEFTYFNSIFYYMKGLDAGKYGPLNGEILSTADNVTVEHWQGQYLLCVGSNHVILQITKDWTTEESVFMTNGSIRPSSDGDSISYDISGEEGEMDNASIGGTDILPLLEKLGTISADGAMVHKQLQISAKGTFDAPSLYIMSENDSGEIEVAVLKYNEQSEKYEWDNEIISTNERCCFNKDGAFCYIDAAGTLCVL